jgi:transposase-like protein
MSQCPYCHDSENQIKAGKTGVGSQRWQCKPCHRRYTPEPQQMDSDEMRRQAINMYADGASFRQVARHFEIDHVSVINWVKAHIDQLPAAPVPAEKPLHIVEMDELYTFGGKKKTGSPW